MFTTAAVLVVISITGPGRADITVVGTRAGGVGRNADRCGLTIIVFTAAAVLVVISITFPIRTDVTAVGTRAGGVGRNRDRRHLTIRIVAALNITAVSLAFRDNIRG